MGWITAPGVMLALLGAMLVSAGVEDARTREIANWKNAAIALAAPLWWWTAGLSPWPDMAVQLLVGGLVFALFVGVFALGMMGGGDVKLIGALALWLPPALTVTTLVVMSVAGGVVTLLMMAERRWLHRGAAAPIEVPYGVAIALAGLITLREPILNHWS